MNLYAAIVGLGLLLQQEEPLLEMWVSGGLVTREMAEDFARRPHFALYADGSVVFRQGINKYFKAKLSPEETKKWIQEALDLDLLKLTPKDLPNLNRPPPPDSGSEALVFRQKDKSNRLSLPYWLSEYERHFPDNPKLAALKKIRQWIASFKSDSGVPE
jgi:hypothetical protein